MGDQHVMSVFCYAFKPSLSTNVMDGGFTVNLYTDHQLIFNTYDNMGYCTSATSFQLNDYTTQRYLRMVEYARPWLNNMPARMSGYDGSIDGEYSFGLNGYSIIRVQNMKNLVAGEYRDTAAHYARLLYSLMENFSTLLYYYGIDFRLDQFTWTANAPVLPPVAGPQNFHRTQA